MGQKLNRSNALRYATARGYQPGSAQYAAFEDYANGGSLDPMMATIGHKSAGLTMKSLGKAVGGLTKTGLPALIPGVGPLAAAAIGVGGSVAAGGNMRDHLKAGGTSLLASGGKELLSHAPGVDAIGDRFKALNLPDLPNLHLPDMPQGPAGAGQVGKDLLSHGLEAIGNHPDAILGGLGLYEGLKDRKAANKLQSTALNRLNEKPAEDVSGLFADPGNPYATGRPIAPAPVASARPAALGGAVQGMAGGGMGSRFRRIG